VSRLAGTPVVPVHDGRRTAEYRIYSMFSRHILRPGSGQPRAWPRGRACCAGWILDTGCSILDARYEICFTQNAIRNTIYERRATLHAIRATNDELAWRMEKRLVPNLGKCLFHRHIAEHFAPLAGVAHVRKIETAVGHVCKSRKAVFKKRR
jgi:hypothetical protein